MEPLVVIYLGLIWKTPVTLVRYRFYIILPPASLTSRQRMVRMLQWWPNKKPRAFKVLCTPPSSHLESTPDVNWIKWVCLEYFWEFFQTWRDLGQFHSNSELLNFIYSVKLYQTSLTQPPSHDSGPTARIEITDQQSQWSAAASLDFRIKVAAAALLQVADSWTSPWDYNQLMFMVSFLVAGRRGRSVSLQVLDREGLELRLQLSGSVPKTHTNTHRGGAVIYVSQVIDSVGSTLLPPAGICHKQPCFPYRPFKSKLCPGYIKGCLA